MDYKLRTAQEEILKYRGGKMAVSAVPGSGKTFILSLLAARLIDDGHIDVEGGEQVLIVTCLNASVDTFRARIRQHLRAMDNDEAGFDVRTLHSLALEIARSEVGGAGADLVVLDESQADHYLNRAVNDWIDNNPRLWNAFLPEEYNLQMRTRWRRITESTARAFIQSAKNQRYYPEQIQGKLEAAIAAVDEDRQTSAPDFFRQTGGARPLLAMLNGIYARYDSILVRQGAVDFDDLIWRAADLLERRPVAAETFRGLWPYVLEDEAQDSVPLQEALLAALTGPSGNWVRVGDPNQAITSSFTAAHPRHFNAFLEREDVVLRPLPNSGRSAPRIIGAANHVLHWVMDQHPVPEVRRHTFRRQDILPTPPGDAQPNPPDMPHNIRVKTYAHREDEELPAVARLARRFASSRPDETVAILVPTNRVGYRLAEELDAIEADYDNVLRSNAREREIAAAMHALLALLANPLDRQALVEAHRALHELEHPAVAEGVVSGTVRDGDAQYLVSGFQPGSRPETERFHTLLRSVHRPELLLFPEDEQEMTGALPQGVATPAELDRLRQYVGFLRQLFELRELPVEDMALALSNELFASPAGGNGRHEQDLSIAYQIAFALRRWRDLQPDWRLPELVARLGDIASGRRSLPGTTPTDFGFEPAPGRITLATQHGAKGLEWDAVFLVGIDGFWIPGDLDAPFLGVHDFLGGDPAAEAAAELRQLMEGNAGLYPERSATEAAHIEVISERLRLFYVGLTRARRYLHVSRSRITRYYQREREAQTTRVLEALRQYVREE